MSADALYLHLISVFLSSSSSFSLSPFPVFLISFSSLSLPLPPAPLLLQVLVYNSDIAHSVFLLFASLLFLLFSVLSVVVCLVYSVVCVRVCVCFCVRNVLGVSPPNVSQYRPTTTKRGRGRVSATAVSDTQRHILTPPPTAPFERFYLFFFGKRKDCSY